MPRQLPVFYEGKLGQYFRDLREGHGWSLRQTVLIADQRRLPVKLGALRWLEGGLTKNPEPELVRALSKLYGEPYGRVVQEVTRYVFAIKPDALLEGTTPPTSIEGFVAIPLIAEPIAAGRPMSATTDPDHDTSLAFHRNFVKRFTRPVALRVGPKEASMTPTIEPGDIVLIDQNLTRRRRPPAGRVYAINLEPVTGANGGALHRIDLSGHTLILSADNSDKAAYPTRTFETRRAHLPEVLVGEVVWIARTLRTAT